MDHVDLRVRIVLVFGISVGALLPLHAATLLEHPPHSFMPTSNAVIVREYLNHDVGRSLLSANVGLRTFAAGYRPETSEELRALASLDLHLPENFIREFAVARIAHHEANVAETLRQQFIRGYEQAGDDALLDYTERLEGFLAAHSDDPLQALQQSLRQLAPYSLYGQKLGRRVTAMSNVVNSVAHSDEIRAHARELAMRLVEDHSFLARTDPAVHHGQPHLDYTPTNSLLMAPSQRLLRTILTAKTVALIEELPRRYTKAAQTDERSTVNQLIRLAVVAPFDDICEFILNSLLALDQTATRRVDVLSRIGEHPSLRILELVSGLLSAERHLARGNSRLETAIEQSSQKIARSHLQQTPLH